LSVKQDFQVEVRGDHIIVTFVGTSFCELSEAKEGASLVAVGLFKTSRGNLSPSGGIYLGCADPRQREGQKARLDQSPLMALADISGRLGACPLSWVKQTSPTPAYDPERTL